MQALYNKRNAGNEGSTTGKHETSFHEQLNPIRDSLSNLASSENKGNGEDEKDDEEDTEHGQLSEVDEPSWVIGQIFSIVQLGMENVHQKQMRLGELKQLGWWDTADTFWERDIVYRTA